MEFDLSLQMSILHIEIFSMLIWNTLKSYTLSQQKMGDYIIKYLIHITSMYESLQNYNI
jgi:hypothetical protein